MTLKNARVYQALLRRLSPVEEMSLRPLSERRTPRAYEAAGRDPQRQSPSWESSAPRRVWSSQN